MTCRVISVTQNKPLTGASREPGGHGPQKPSGIFLFLKQILVKKLANSSGCANAKKAFSFKWLHPRDPLTRCSIPWMLLDTRLKVSWTWSKLTCMRVHYFRCYWPSNLVFDVRCVAYIPNLRKIGQKLRSLSWTIGIVDRQTHKYTHRHIIKWFYICPMPCIALDRQLRA